MVNAATCDYEKTWSPHYTSQMFSGLRATIQREMDTVLDQPHTRGGCKSEEDHANACNDGPQ